MANSNSLLLNALFLGVATMAGASVLSRARAGFRLTFGLLTLATGYSAVVSFANYIGPLAQPKVAEPTELFVGAAVALMMVSTAYFKPLNQA